MNPNMLKKGVYWVGAVDFNLHSFHHYSTSPSGTTYNAYFIDDEKKTLVDTVSCEYIDEMLEQLSKYIEPSKIDYLVCHHLERDHAGALPKIVEICKPEIIFCSKLGLQSMKGQFDTTGWNIKTVEDGETISLGKRSLTFYETRMIHWPDSMISYLSQDNIIFSNDAFGQNIASACRFVDEIPREKVYEEMKHYYANIVLPFSNLVLKLLDKITALNLNIDIIAPDHGLIFRRKEDIDFLLNAYKEFATQEFKKSAVIVYDSMWGATEKMAYIIGDTLYDQQIPYTLIDIQKNHVATVMNALMDASLLLLGSSTRNNLPMTATMGLINHIKGLKPLNKKAAAFGSYGWSGEAQKIITECLKDMKFDIIAEPLRIQYGLKEEQKEQCKQFALQIAKSFI